MKKCFVSLVFISVWSAGSLYAQMPGGKPDIWQRFQEQLAPVSDYSASMVSQSGGNSTSSRVWRLSSKIRMEMEAPEMGAIAMLSDPELANDQGGKGVAYTLFLARKLYMKTALPAGASGTTRTEADVSVEELGRETVTGLVCDKRRVTIKELASKQVHVLLLWVSSSVRNMPVQIESTEQGVTSTIQFRGYSFEKPAASLFTVPADFVPMGGFPGMLPGAAGVPQVSAPTQPGSPAPGLTISTPVAAITLQPGGANAPATNVPPASVGETAKQAVKDTTQTAVQEGVNLGIKKVFGW